MSEAPPGSTAATKRDDSAEVRIANRSTFWSAALLYSVSFLAACGGSLGTLVLGFEIDDQQIGYGILASLLFIGGMGLVFLPFPDTVDWIKLGDNFRVKRIHSRRTFLPDRVVRVELTTPKGEDYDDEQFALRYVELRVRVRGLWPVWLLVTHDDVATVRAWAVAHGRPIVDRTG